MKLAFAHIKTSIINIPVEKYDSSKWHPQGEFESMNVEMSAKYAGVTCTLGKQQCVAGCKHAW